MTDVLHSYQRDLAIKGYSPKTRTIYYDHVSKFLKNTDKPEHIIADTMRVRIEQGKGNKGRYTILAGTCLTYLRQYFRKYRPSRWLFEGYTRGNPISIRACQHAFELAKKKAGIRKECSFHSLRHSFATHFLESGGGLFQLQKFLGHKHIKTTLIYAHMQEEKVIARSPLDVYAKPGQFNHS
jgi:integrase/recombinase XerD